MLRMSVETKLAPATVIEKAHAYFGGKGLKLDEEQASADSAVYTGGGGFVSIWAGAGEEGKGTEVILETREWEFDVKHFAGSIPK